MARPVLERPVLERPVLERPVLERPVTDERTAYRSLGDEGGSTLLLTIFYGFLSVALILVVVAASSLYLERKRLFTLADGAALAGAEAFNLEAVAVGSTPRATLKSSDVRNAVTDYLATVPAHRFESLTLEEAATIDGHSATVRLSSYWRPPIVSVLLPEGIRIEVETVGRSVFS